MKALVIAALVVLGMVVLMAAAIPGGPH